MKKILITGVIISFALLLCMPVIPAIEFTTVTNTNKVNSFKGFQSDIITQLKQKLSEVKVSGKPLVIPFFLIFIITYIGGTLLHRMIHYLLEGELL